MKQFFNSPHQIALDDFAWNWEVGIPRLDGLKTLKFTNIKLA